MKSSKFVSKSDNIDLFSHGSAETSNYKDYVQVNDKISISHNYDILDKTNTCISSSNCRLYNENIDDSCELQYYIYAKKYFNQSVDPIQLIIGYKIIVSIFNKSILTYSQDLYTETLTAYLTFNYPNDYNNAIDIEIFNDEDQTVVEESYVLLLAIFHKISDQIIDINTWIKVLFISSKYSLVLFYESSLAQDARNIPYFNSINERINALKEMEKFVKGMVPTRDIESLFNDDNLTLDKLIKFERLTVRLAQVSKLSNNDENTELLVGKVVDEMELNPFQSLGRKIVVLLNVVNLNHSCLPNASVDPADNDESTSKQRLCNLNVKLIALKDIILGEEITRNYLVNHSNYKYLSYKKRKKLLRKFKISCRCCLCLYESSFESDPNYENKKKQRLESSRSELTISDLVNIASYYMSIDSKSTAISLYNEVISIVNNKTESTTNDLQLLGECYYALGLIEYESGLWLNGQKYWLEGFSKSSDHKLLSDQILKLHSYVHLHYYSKNEPSCNHNLPYENDSFSKIIESNEFINYNSITINKRAYPSIFLTNTSLLNATECNKIILSAESYAKSRNGWTTSRHYTIPTTDIPITELPDVLRCFNQLLKDSIGPILANQFKLKFSNKIIKNAYISINDAFIVKYEQSSKDKLLIELIKNDSDYVKHPILEKLACDSYSDNHGSQRYLPLHSDQSTHSFIIPLNSNDEYIGGGTYFADYKDSINADLGHMISFDGDLIHSGDPLLYGKRYIIAAFLYVHYEVESLNQCYSSSTENKTYSFDFNM